MRSSLLLLVLTLLSAATYGQKYIINDGTTGYDTLTSFESVQMKDPTFSEELAFPFGFDFAYFGKNYDSVYIDGSGYCSFRDGDDERYAYFYAGEFAPQKNLSSDWRYGNTTIDGSKALVVEWKNVAIDDENYKPTPADHGISFQVQFFEDGRIRLVFGDMNLSNTQFFNPQKGFVWSDNEVYGPWIGIAQSDEFGYHIGGDIDNYFVVTSEDSSDVVTGTPQKGQYLEFAPDVQSQAKGPELSDFSIYPNPTTGNLTVQLADFSGQASLQVLTAQGQLLQTVETQQATRIALNVDGYQPGVYLVRLIHAQGFATQTFIKK